LSLWHFKNKGRNEFVLRRDVRQRVSDLISSTHSRRDEKEETNKETAIAKNKETAA